jgi:hypothetical protein
VSKGYTLYADNKQSSPTPSQRLLEARTNILGAVRLKWKQISQDLRQIRIKKGDAVALYNHMMIAIK